MPFTIKRSTRSSINIIKFFKTSNLTDDLSKRIIEELQFEKPFKVWENKREGFNEEFIFNEENKCDLDFFLVNEDYGNMDVDYDDNNLNHIKLFKVNYVIESSGDADQFIDIFLIPEYNLILVNGSKKESKNVIKILQKTLKFVKGEYKTFEYHEINFLPEFLLWLIYKKSKNDSLSDNISIEKFYDFATEDFINEEGFLNSNSIPCAISTEDGDNIITLPI